jgi:hypothetical protein
MIRLLSILALLWCCSAQAATYYLAPTGNDSTGDGSIGSPWATLNKGTEGIPGTTYLQPGDTLYLRGGHYNGAANMIDLPAGQGVSGTSNAPIRIAAYQSEVPIIGQTMSNFASVVFGGKSWWVFDSLCYSNVHGWMQYTTVTNLTITNCNLTTGQEGFETLSYPGLLFTGDSQFNRILNNRIHDFGGPYGTGGTSGTYTLGSTLMMIGNETTDPAARYNLVQGNEFWSGGHGCLEIPASHNVIRSNLFHNAPTIAAVDPLLWMPNFGNERTETNMYGLWGARIIKSADGGDVPNLDVRNVWEDNRMFYTGPPADTGGSFGIEVASSRAIYRRNSIAFALAGGVYFTPGGSETMTCSNAFYGNVIYGSGLAETYGGTQMQSYTYGMLVNGLPTRVFTNYVVNNIIWANLPGDIDPAVYNDQVVRTNWIGGVGLGSPLFTSTNGIGYTYDAGNLPDFTLQSNSPCIDAGTFLTTATGSGTSTTLPVANALYFSDGNKVVDGDSIQLEGSTNTSIVTLCDWTNNVLYLDAPLTFSAGQGVALAYQGSAPDMGAFEGASTNEPPPYIPPTSQTASPTFSPNGGTFTNSVSVTISCATPAALMWYSTGTATTNSGPYTGSFTIYNNATISAIAAAPGYTASATASATFTKYSDPEPGPPAASGSFSVDALQLNRIIRR